MPDSTSTADADAAASSSEDPPQPPPAEEEEGAPSAAPAEGGEAAAASSGNEGGGGGGGGETTSSTSSGSDPLLDGSSSDTSGDDDDGDDDDDDDKDSPPNADPTALLTEAMTLKEEGNAAFKSGDLTLAVRQYRKGASRLKSLNRGNSGDEQVKALLLTLHTNLSTVCFKQNKFKMSRDVASRALEVDPTHVKALFRRACAYRKMGYDDEARADLRAALKIDPANAAVKRELRSLKAEMDGKKKAEGDRLKKAFGAKAGGSFLYEDREAEERRKEEEKRRKKEEERAAKELRKMEWEDECVKRMADNKEAISFEDWEKERKKKEEEKEKERKKKAKEERKKIEAERKAAKERERAARKDAGGGSSDEDDDHGLTKSELQSLRGYKKTSDGRTTSYFSRELSDEQKAMIGDIAPQRLDAASSSSSPTAAATAADPSASSASASVWNQAGTWEEKDTSDWCHSCLSRHLSSASASPLAEDFVGEGEYVARVTEVKSLTGDASVALAGGKKKYIFDYHASVKYDVVFRSAAPVPATTDAPSEQSPADAAEEEKVVASGSLKLPEINSGAAASHEEMEVDVPGTWKKAPRDGHGNAARACRERLVTAVRASVTDFVREFNAQY